MFYRLSYFFFKSVCLFFILLFNINIASAWEGEREEAMKLTANMENGKKIYQFCVSCHYETGWSDNSIINREHAPGFLPQIAGQHKNVIIKQLADIRSGNRDNPIMYPYSLNQYLENSQAIADVSAYIATLPTNPVNQVGNGLDLQLGKDLYRTNCKTCHGVNGQGSNKEFFPRIQGQHYNYLLKQFIWIRDGRRRNANKQMMRQIQRFTFREMTAVIDYVSRLKPIVKKQ
ncbi:MAG: c-type cytochrome [Pseudomonadota bacterium]